MAAAASKDQMIAVLEDRVVELEELLGVGPEASDQYAKLGLTPFERRTLGYIVKREIATKDGMFGALYAHMPDCDRPDDIKSSLGVRLWNIRNALDPHGIVVTTIHGVGWRMDNENKSKLAELMKKMEYGPRQPQKNNRGVRRRG